MRKHGSEASIQNPGSDIEHRVTGREKRPQEGFTLIELLAAMSILLIITLIVAQLFQQASVSWDTGLRKAESTMMGRALADYIAQDLATAVRDDDRYKEFDVSAGTPEFWAMGEATGAKRALTYVTYNNTWTTRTVWDRPGGSQLESAELVGSGVTVTVNPVGGTATSLPLYAIVKVVVGGAVQYQSTAYFINNKRNNF